MRGRITIALLVASVLVPAMGATTAQGEPRSVQPRPCEVGCPRLGRWRGEEDQWKRRPISFTLAVVEGTVTVTHLELPDVPGVVPAVPLTIDRSSIGGKDEIEYRFDLAYVCAHCWREPIMVDVHGHFDSHDVESMGGTWSDGGPFAADWVDPAATRKAGDKG
jgi:hypothetical protein